MGKHKQAQAHKLARVDNYIRTPAVDNTVDYNSRKAGYKSAHNHQGDGDGGHGDGRDGDGGAPCPPLQALGSTESNPATAPKTDWLMIEHLFLFLLPSDTSIPSFIMTALYEVQAE
ncbi:hypothetical protein [Nitrosomonas sp.]|uniref:hypothetical protein n=1 Tax=Nitrosomonas sp. TaxID=42353 RepID=UPI002849ED52|nr:hypothetical protein [Nitrosomonas sp.]MDR4513905.1 hypothetical protein [Nitrosomonas sp.]